MPLFPDAAVHFQEVVLIISLASIVYGSAMRLTQTNMRLIIAYSSIAQMGFITLGIFSLSGAGGDGAVIQMVNHGLVVAPVFLIIAILAERRGPRTSARWAMAKRAADAGDPLHRRVAMALLAIPGLTNFVGEFFILKGVFETKVAIALIASTGIALAAFYSLRFYQRTMHNRQPEGGSHARSRPEAVVLVPPVACIVALSLYPALITTRGEDAVDRSLAAVTPDATPPPEAAAATGEGWTGYAPPRRAPRDRHARHRLRRALAGDRARRRDLRGPARRPDRTARRAGRRRDWTP